MSSKVNKAEIAASSKSAELSVSLLFEIVSRLGPDGLRSLAVEADRLAGLAIAEGRDSVGLGDLSESFRSHAKRLDPQQVTN